MGLSSAFGSNMTLATMANGGGGILKRQALALKNDPDGNGKFIAGLNEIRVRSREEALAVFRSGQSARQVFGTMANRESSRSHGIFNIKLVRIHNGAPEDPESASVSRLSIVDLAGSERSRNTGNTGDRLKEAGNINKSLMVCKDGEAPLTLRFWVNVWKCYGRTNRRWQHRSRLAIAAGWRWCPSVTRS